MQRWLEEARAAEEPLPDAMALATATPDGAPSVRMVMLRGLEGGPVFFTDGQSAKGAELHANPRAAVVLHWLLPIQRQKFLLGRILRRSRRAARAQRDQVVMRVLQQPLVAGAILAAGLIGAALCVPLARVLLRPHPVA